MAGRMHESEPVPLTPSHSSCLTVFCTLFSVFFIRQTPFSIQPGSEASGPCAADRRLSRQLRWPGGLEGHGFLRLLVWFSIMSIFLPFFLSRPYGIFGRPTTFYNTLKSREESSAVVVFGSLACLLREALVPSVCMCVCVCCLLGSSYMSKGIGSRWRTAFIRPCSFPLLYMPLAASLPPVTIHRGRQRFALVGAFYSKIEICASVSDAPA